MPRLALAWCLAVGLVLSAAREAPAVTLKLTFSDGQPAGTVTLTLRPARGTHTLHLKLKRDGRAAAARSVARRRG